jgi:hypothetical protein
MIVTDVKPQRKQNDLCLLACLNSSMNLLFRLPIAWLSRSGLSVVSSFVGRRRGVGFVGTSVCVHARGSAVRLANTASVDVSSILQLCEILRARAGSFRLTTILSLLSVFDCVHSVHLRI